MEKRGYQFQGKGGTKSIFNRAGIQRQNWRTGNIRKQFSIFGGTGEQANLFQRNKGTGIPLGGLHHKFSNFTVVSWKMRILIVM